MPIDVILGAATWNTLDKATLRFLEIALCYPALSYEEYLHRYSMNNWASVQKSKRLGCFYCKSIWEGGLDLGFYEMGGYAAKDSDASSKVPTALCPHCGVDTVLGDADVCLSPKLLEQMHDYWFDFGWL